MKAGWLPHIVVLCPKMPGTCCFLPLAGWLEGDTSYVHIIGDFGVETSHHSACLLSSVSTNPRPAHCVRLPWYGSSLC
ncbi:hypothetical protein ACOMHN_029240 [Nucella lapillus]